jgi:hypothetical protein
VAFHLPAGIGVKVDRVSWTLYLAGSLLVFFSWMALVPSGLGWFGWLMALAGWAAGNRPGRHASRSYADEIQKLDALRRQSVITDDEFQQQKHRLLH